MLTNSNFPHRAEVEISAYGRILFAPEDCQGLKLTPEMTLTVGEGEGENERSGNESAETKTILKGCAVVIQGELTGDCRDIVEQLREERIQQNMRLHP